MDELGVAVAGLVLAVLAYFGGVLRGKHLQRCAEAHAERLRDESWRREDELRRADESWRRVEGVVTRVQHLLTSAGGSHGVHLETVQEAGIRSLSDHEIRLALRDIAVRTRIALPEAEWSQLTDVDLQKVFRSLYGKLNLSGGPPSIVRAVEHLRSEGVEILRAAV